jgi:hypothetical protein
MMADVRALVPAGFRDIWYVVLGSDGFPTLANGGNVGMTQLVGAKTGQIGIPEADRLTPTGDDGALGAVFEFESTEQPTGTLTVGVHNVDAHAAFAGTLVDGAAGGSINVLGAKGTTRPSLLMLFTRRAVSKDAATSGLVAEQQYALPRAQLRPLGSENYQERAESPDRYGILANDTTKEPHGKPITLTDHGTLSGPILEIYGTSRAHYHFFKGNNSTATVVLPYTPSSATDFEVYDFTAGTAITATLDVGTKTVTFAAAPSAGKLCGIMYRRAA